MLWGIIYILKIKQWYFKKDLFGPYFQFIVNIYGNNIDFLGCQMTLPATNFPIQGCSKGVIWDSIELVYHLTI